MPNNLPDKEPRKTVWQTLTFEMRARVILAALVLPLAIPCIVFEIDNRYILTPFVILVLYWALRSIFGRLFHFFGITKTNGSLFEHLFAEGVNRSQAFGNIVILVGLGWLLYGCLFSPNAPPWFGK